MVGPQPRQKTASAQQYGHQYIPAAIDEHGGQHHLDAGGLGHVRLQELAEQGEEKQGHFRIQERHQKAVAGSAMQDVELAGVIHGRQRLPACQLFQAIHSRNKAPLRLKNNSSDG